MAGSTQQPATWPARAELRSPHRPPVACRRRSLTAPWRRSPWGVHELNAGLPSERPRPAALGAAADPRPCGERDVPSADLKSPIASATLRSACPPTCSRLPA